MVLHYQLCFQKQIAEIALKVRAGNPDEKIPDILEQVFSSEFLFSPVLLDQWLDTKEKEIVIMEETVKFFKNDWKEIEELEDSDDLKFALQPGKLEKIVHSFKFDCVVSFEFIINQKNAFLSTMEEYLQKEKVPESSVTMSWFKDTSSLRKYAKLFKQLMVEKTRKSRQVERLVQDSPSVQQKFPSMIHWEANDIEAVPQKDKTSCDKAIQDFLNAWKWEQSTSLHLFLPYVAQKMPRRLRIQLSPNTLTHRSRSVIPFPKITN